MTKRTINRAKLRNLGYTDAEIEKIVRDVKQGHFEVDPPENFAAQIIESIKTTSIRLASECLKKGVHADEAMTHLHRCEHCKRAWDNEMKPRH